METWMSLVVIFIIVFTLMGIIQKCWKAGLKAKADGARCPFTTKCNYFNPEAKKCTGSLGIGCYKYKE